jgi:dihydroorotase
MKVFQGVLKLTSTKNLTFSKGLNPHMYCLPVAKPKTYCKAAVSTDTNFFFGSVSTPHPIASKEKAGGAAGICNTTTAISHVAWVFEQEAALENLEAFMSLNGANFYGLVATSTDNIRCKNRLVAWRLSKPLRWVTTM